MRPLSTTVLTLIAAALPLLAQTNYTINTVAGGGTAIGSSATNVSATTVAITAPFGVAADSNGNFYVADQSAGAIREVSSKGIITTLTATPYPKGVAVDSTGAVYFSDLDSATVSRLVGSTVTVIAGDKASGFSGDGGAATKAGLNSPYGIAVSSSGDVYIADLGNNRIRKVSGGNITTVAGSSSSCPSSTTAANGDGGPATSALLCSPSGVALDATGNLYIADTFNHRIRKVTNGVITTIAGTGTYGYTGDNGTATSATISNPVGLALDSSGNLFIADANNAVIREVSGGTITTIAGLGPTSAGFAGDGGPAVFAKLDSPESVAISGSTIYVADYSNHRIRTLTPLVVANGAPTISRGGIVPVYSTSSTIQPGSWISVYGTNLTTSPSPVFWNNDFPTALGGTSVTINGKPAFLWFVSPTQINAQAPDDTTTGLVPVVVKTPMGSYTWDVMLAAYAPSFSMLDATHIAGIILRSDGSGAYGGGTYDILGPTGSSLGYPTVAVKGGDNVALFGVGLGPTSPVVTSGQAYSGAAKATYGVYLTVNKQQVVPSFAGLVSAGLYQINFTMPAGLGTGDVPITINISSTVTPAGPVISLNDPAQGVQSVTLSSSSAYNGGGNVTGTVQLVLPAAAGGVYVSLSASPAGAMTLPSYVTVAAGSTSATFTITPGNVSANTPVTISAALYNSSASATATLTVTPPLLNPNCATVGGSWNVTESGTTTTTLVAAGQSETGSGSIYGYGALAITQNGCAIQYTPIISGLTAAQTSELVRSGSVSGNNVMVTGELTPLSVVEADETEANPGLIINSANVTANTLTATGTVSANGMQLTETGTFAANGSFYDQGESGSYTITITSSSTANFTWASGTRPQVRPGESARTMHVEVNASGALSDATAKLRAVFEKALVFLY
jgi:uncharacterized protein (TIGR03437 family)